MNIKVTEHLVLKKKKSKEKCFIQKEKLTWKLENSLIIHPSIEGIIMYLLKLLDLSN